MLLTLFLSAVVSTPAVEVPLPHTAAFELLRFPPRGESFHLWQRSIAYRDWQRLHLRMGPTAALAWREAIAEAEALERAWDLLTFAQSCPHDETKAQRYLDELREQLGEEAYQRGIMPPPAPKWFRAEWLR
jgi:hypothetical protein